MALDPRERSKRPEKDIIDLLEQKKIVGSLPEAPENFDERQLCPDGACIGVVGQDGSCNECGKRI